MIMRRGSVVLLEDEPDLRALMADGLREHGFDVIEARKAEEALTAIALCEGNTILVADRTLGETGPNGFQLAATAMERYPGLRVIYVSGTHIAVRHRQLSERERGLMKPFALSQLLTLVRHLA